MTNNSPITNATDPPVIRDYRSRSDPRWWLSRGFTGFVCFLLGAGIAGYAWYRMIIGASSVDDSPGPLAVLFVYLLVPVSILLLGIVFCFLGVFGRFLIVCHLKGKRHCSGSNSAGVEKWCDKLAMPIISVSLLSRVNRVIMCIAAIFTASIVFFSFSQRGLSNNESGYRRGLAENGIRLRMGMRRIEPTWTCFSSIHGKDTWMIDGNKDTTAAKVVTHNRNILLVSEADRYFSGRVVSIGDGMPEETITLVCDYTSKQLEIVYIGDSTEIKSWISDAGTNNQACLDVIARVKKRWRIGNGR